MSHFSHVLTKGYVFDVIVFTRIDDLFQFLICSLSKNQQDGVRNDVIGKAPIRGLIRSNNGA